MLRFRLEGLGLRGLDLWSFGVRESPPMIENEMKGKDSGK